MIEIARTADDKKAGLTVAELRKFLGELDHAGIPDEATISGVVGIRTQLQKIKTSG